jgi:hypothetical protein
MSSNQTHPSQPTHSSSSSDAQPTFDARQMYEAMQTMQNQIHQLKHEAAMRDQHHPSLLKPTKPSEFNGEPGDNVNLWIAELTRYFAATNQTGNARTVFAIALLKKKALEWVTHEPSLATHRASHVSFEEFADTLRAYFSPIANSKQARYDLDALKYTNIHDFNSSFRSIISRIDDISELDKMHRYTTKLPHKYQLACMNPPHTSLMQCMNTATNIDSVLHLTTSSSYPSSSSSASSSDAMQIDMLNSLHDTGLVDTDELHALMGRMSVNNKWSKEKEDLFKQGRCFICRETGHRMNECPKRSNNRRPFNRNNSNNNNNNNRRWNNNNNRSNNNQSKNESSQ